MKTSKQIREAIGELLDKCQAINALAEQEKRDLTDDEKADLDGLMAQIGDDDGEKPTGLYADLRRAERLEALQASITAQRVGGDGASSTEVADAPRASRITVPAQCRYRSGQLRSYRGQDANQRAYLAGRFLAATLFRDNRSAEWCREHGVDVSFRGALKESSNSLGGFLVPEEMEQSIIDLREQYGVFRREARVTPMSRDVKVQPVRSSGLTAYFVGEGKEITASDKAWGQIELVARKIAALVKYSSELSEDALIDIGDDLTSEIAYAFANKEDSCGFLGDGTSTYGGIKGLINALAAGSKVTAATGNTAFSTLDLTDFESMVGKLPEFPGIQPKWYIHKAGWAASMLRLAAAAGGNTIANIEGGGGMSFLGYPVVFSQLMNSTLTAQTSTDGLCYFGDLKMGAVLGNRRGLSIATSDDRYFENDQIGIKGTSRFDINIHSTGTASAAGAIIMLSTPAS